MDKKELKEVLSGVFKNIDELMKNQEVLPYLERIANTVKKVKEEKFLTKLSMLRERRYKRIENVIKQKKTSGFTMTDEDFTMSNIKNYDIIKAISDEMYIDENFFVDKEKGY